MTAPHPKPNSARPPSVAESPKLDRVDNDEVLSQRLLTIPNALCLVRLLGSPLLVWLALAGMHAEFVWFFVFLAMTDWVDGKIARWLNQRSVWGARLDSWADVALYSALLLGAFILKGDVLRREAAWLGAAISSYVVTTLVGFWKFHRWPSYHTRMAKTCWFLTTVAALFVLSNGNSVPLRLAALAVCVTNIEAICISLLLDQWHANVPSIFHALKLRRHERRSSDTK